MAGMEPRLQRLLARRSILRLSELGRHGFPAHRVADLVASGALVKASFGAYGEVRGLYAAPDADLDEDYDACMACLMTGGVLGGPYMAMRHGLAPEVMADGIRVYAPFDSATTRHRAGIELVRTRRAAVLTAGVEERATGLGVTVRQTNPARTVVDLFRAKATQGEEYRYAMEAFGTYKEKGGTDSAIAAVAREFEPWLADLIETASEAYDRGAGLRP